MLGAEKPDRKVNERDTKRAQHCQSGCQHWRLSAGRETSKKEVAYVNKPHNQGGGEPEVPRPPDAPDRTRPDRTCDQIDGLEYDADFRRRQRDDIRNLAALDQVIDRRSEIDEEKDECGPGRRYVIVDDPINVALQLVGWSDFKCLIKGVAQQNAGENHENGEEVFHGSTLSFEPQPGSLEQAKALRPKRITRSPWLEPRGFTPR